MVWFLTKSWLTRLWTRLTDRRLSHPHVKVAVLSTFTNRSSDLADIPIVFKPGTDLAILNFIGSLLQWAVLTNPGSSVPVMGRDFCFPDTRSERQRPIAPRLEREREIDGPAFARKNSYCITEYNFLSSVGKSKSYHLFVQTCSPRNLPTRTMTTTTPMM